MDQFFAKDFSGGEFAFLGIAHLDALLGIVLLNFYLLRYKAKKRGGTLENPLDDGNRAVGQRTWLAHLECVRRPVEHPSESQVIQLCGCPSGMIV
jgi:hypothetical protein